MLLTMQQRAAEGSSVQEHKQSMQEDNEIVIGTDFLRNAKPQSHNES